MQKDTTKRIGEGVKFERTRRITGYLVGTLDRWNNAKRKEEKDRLKHDIHPGRREEYRDAQDKDMRA